MKKRTDITETLSFYHDGNFIFKVEDENGGMAVTAISRNLGVIDRTKFYYSDVREQVLKFPEEFAAYIAVFDQEDLAIAGNDANDSADDARLSSGII